MLDLALASQPVQLFLVPPIKSASPLNILHDFSTSFVYVFFVCILATTGLRSLHPFLSPSWQQGCQYYITDAIRFHLYYIGTIGLAFGFFELTAALVAMQQMEGL